MADEEQIGPTRWDSVLFDRRKYEDRPEVVSLRDDLFASLRAEYPTMRYVSDTRETLALVLVNLLYAELLESTPYVAYYRDNNQFGPGTRYKALGIRRKPFQRTTRWLAKEGFVTESPGRDFPDTGVSYTTRMRATEKLQNIFAQYGWSAAILQPDPPSEPVVLRDLDGNDIDLPATPMVASMKRSLHMVNDFLSSVRIEIDGVKRPVGYYRRIFNRESFDYGGRWYGHWIQKEKNDARKVGEANTRESKIRDGRLTLNDEATIEMDYHAMHLTMLYSIKKIEPKFTDRNGVCDGYGLADFGFGREYRPLIKNLCMYYINNASKRSVTATINKMLFTDELRQFQGADIGSVMSAFEETHSDVFDMFFKEWGPRLQRFDSDIVEGIMLYFVERDIPCLSIHDSFIVPRRCRNMLGKAMDTVWRDVIGFGRPLFTE